MMIFQWTAIAGYRVILVSLLKYRFQQFSIFRANLKKHGNSSETIRPFPVSFSPPQTLWLVVLRNVWNHLFEKVIFKEVLSKPIM